MKKGFSHLSFLFCVITLFSLASCASIKQVWELNGILVSVNGQIFKEKTSTVPLDLTCGKTKYVFTATSDPVENGYPIKIQTDDNTIVTVTQTASNLSEYTIHGLKCGYTTVQVSCGVYYHLFNVYVADSSRGITVAKLINQQEEDIARARAEEAKRQQAEAEAAKLQAEYDRARAEAEAARARAEAARAKAEAESVRAKAEAEAAKAEAAAAKAKAEAERAKAEAEASQNSGSSGSGNSSSGGGGSGSGSGQNTGDVKGIWINDANKARAYYIDSNGKIYQAFSSGGQFVYLPTAIGTASSNGSINVPSPYVMTYDEGKLTAFGTIAGTYCSGNFTKSNVSLRAAKLVGNSASSSYTVRLSVASGFVGSSFTASLTTPDLDEPISYEWYVAGQKAGTTSTISAKILQEGDNMVYCRITGKYSNQTVISQQRVIKGAKAQ